ncbi:MAG TPA: 6-pyruvoyl tetrahydropterin synthase family protein [Planctomycetaceae bacterium]|jgi:6-pyruvoyltetrahydropterin/6-carboxytetrahydropterin synthase
MTQARPQATECFPFRMSEQYRVRVTKDHLVFSAAHFITFNGNVCERLHGHNWRVAVEAAGALDENFYVVDFIALRDAVQKIVAELDHRMLIPTEHRSMNVWTSEREVEITFEDRRWVFPRDDCVLLPLENTTAERLAWWIGQRLCEGMPATALQLVTSLDVEVEENFGQWGICRVPIETIRSAREKEGTMP